MISSESAAVNLLYNRAHWLNSKIHKIKQTFECNLSNLNFALSGTEISIQELLPVQVLWVNWKIIAERNKESPTSSIFAGSKICLDFSPEQLQFINTITDFKLCVTILIFLASYFHEICYNINGVIAKTWF